MGIVQENYWHDVATVEAEGFSDATQFYRCRNDVACVVNASAYTMHCDTGYQGVCGAPQQLCNASWLVTRLASW